jgi:glycosyltransferase involved in cell wall biosynthesis
MTTINSKRILLLTQVLPYPPDSGPKVKTWNVLKYLAQHHEVTLVSFVRGDQSAEVAHLKKYCHAVHTVPMRRSPIADAWAMLRSFVTNQSWMMVRDERQAMCDLIDQLCAQQQFDVAHADQLNMAQYAQRVRGSQQVHKVLDAHNALWLLYKRLSETMTSGVRKFLLQRDWKLLRTYEGKVCREFDGLLAVSKEDQAALEEAAGQKLNAVVIPIAVDTDEVALVQRKVHANHILHIGTMYWPPNIDGIQWFVSEVFPLVRAKLPQVVFDVVGARPPQDLLDLNTRGLGINVTGYVEDPTPYLQQCGVMVVPLRAGGGMRVKILNALSQGLPIVSTTIGAEGIAVTHNKDILIADEPQAFADAVIQLIADEKTALKLGQNGRALIQHIYDYRVACRLIEQAYVKT